MNLLNFLKKKKRAVRKHKKHVSRVAADKDKTKPQAGTGEMKSPKIPKGKEMILSGKEPAPLFIAGKGEVVEGELLDADGQYLLQKLGKETSIASYVYVIPAAKGRPAMVDLTIDGVWAFVRECAKKKITLLKITDVKIKDVERKTKRGEPFTVIQALAKCEDEDGFAHWSAKEEPIYKERAAYKDKKYIGKELKYDPHAATIVLEKAQKKAVISHTSFPRVEAWAFVHNQLLANKKVLGELGLTPEQLLPMGGLKAGRGKYSDVFAEGKKLGYTPDETRKIIAAGGKRLSERKTTEEVSDALKKLDEAGIKGEVVDVKTGEIKPTGTTPPPAGPTASTEKPGAAPKPAKRFLANIKFPEGIPDELLQHLDYALTFGKFKGQTLKQILETNADYLRWFSDDCQGKITKGEELSGFGKAVLVHLNPVFKFLKDNGLVKTDNPTE